MIYNHARLDKFNLVRPQVLNLVNLNYSVRHSIRSYSSNLNPACWRKFKLMYLGQPNYDLGLSGLEAVNFACLRDKLEESFDSSPCSKKLKMRLVFAVLDVFPVEILRTRGKRSTRIEVFSSNFALTEMCEPVSFEEFGIEFIFGDEAVEGVLRLIKDALKSQGKDPETVDVWITYWTSDDVNNNGEDDGLVPFPHSDMDFINMRDSSYSPKV